MNKIFWEYFLDDSVFKIGTYPEIYWQILEKQLQRNSFLR